MKTSCCHSKKYLQEGTSVLCLNQGCDSYLRPTSLSVQTNWRRTFAVFFIIFFFIFSFDDFSFSGDLGEEQMRTREFKELSDLSKPLSKENLRLELDELDILCPDEVFAQILIESAHLESFLSKKVNNLLGMRYPFRRQTTAIGIYLPDSDQIIIGTQKELKKYHSKNHYAVYENWQECVKDYKLWQDECFKLTDKYLAFLGMYYAEDTKYVEKIKSMSRQD